MTDPAPTVLLVEDDPQIRRFLRVTLPAHGIRLLEAATGADGLTQARTRTPEAVLLDLGLPDLDGIQFIRKLREWSPIPIIVLSARGLERDKVGALDAGAEDYLTKPFGVEELLARLRVALRRRAKVSDAAGGVFTTGDLSVDLAGHVVRLRGREVRLTPTEFKLLGALVRNTGKVVTHRQLLIEVWGPGAAANTHYLRVQMHGLRHKLEPTPARPRHLVTEPGVGYRFREEEWSRSRAGRRTRATVSPAGGLPA
jgi:two-component system, OmpR family, KDP operon response regulator KdpE